MKLVSVLGVLCVLISEGSAGYLAGRRFLENELAQEGQTIDAARQGDPGKSGIVAAEVAEGDMLLTRTQKVAFDPESETEAGEGDMEGDTYLTHEQKVFFGLESETKEEEEELLKNTLTRRLMTVVGGVKTWPNAVMPWMFDTQYPVTNTIPPVLSEAVRAIEQSTCIRLPQLQAAPPTGQDYLTIGDQQSGCWSKLGRLGKGAQPVSISQKCGKVGNVAHELSHALGMFHEHSRSDRDQFVDIFFQNIKAGKESNFVKMQSYNLAPFDESSIMMYGSRSFSSNGQLTIESKNDPAFTRLFGQRDALSFYDRMVLNKAYDCAGHCTNQCHNDGYLDKNCVCHCPPGISGHNCDDFDTTNYTCGGLVRLGARETYQFTSPNYPSSSNGADCAWVFLAHDGNYLELTVKLLSLTDSDELEIRYNIPGQEGIKFSNLVDRRFSTYHRVGKTMSMFLKSTSASSTGFEAEIRAAVPNACASHSCLNDGACNDNGHPTAFTCTCPTGFSGIRCELIELGTLAVDFENDTDTLHQLKTVDQMDWTQRYGGTPTSNTGPAGAQSGMLYAYVEASSPALPGSEAVLETDMILGMVDRTLTFFYHMHGKTMGSLRVVKHFNDGTESDLWNVSGNQGTDWKRVEISINAETTDYKLRFVGKIGSGWSSDIALDNVVLQANGHGLSPASTNQPPMSTQVPLLSEFYVDFESDTDEVFVKSPVGVFNWTRKEGRTPSNRTGPSTSSQGDWYVFTEASGPRKEGDFAILQTDLYLDLSEERCLSFDYHMYGTGMGKIQVILIHKDDHTDDNDQEIIWTMEGNQGDKWRPAQVWISPRKESKLVFMGVIGNDYRSDMAIDNVRFNTSCLTSLQDFESDTEGFELSDNWSRRKGKTPSNGTGPDSAHNGEYYIFMETSTGNSQSLRSGESAEVTTLASFNTSVCVNFFYHMKGKGMGKLQVGYVTGTGFSSVWVREDDQGDDWLEESVAIPKQQRPYKIRFMGTKGKNWSSDIALDDINIVEGEC